MFKNHQNIHNIIHYIIKIKSPLAVITCNSMFTAAINMFNFLHLNINFKFTPAVLGKGLPYKYLVYFLNNLQFVTTEQHKQLLKIVEATSKDS